MRLIDADEFKKDIRELGDEAHFEQRVLHYSTRDIVYNIDARETIDAIPIQFIFDKMMEGPEMTKHCFMMLVNEWRLSQK